MKALLIGIQNSGSRAGYGGLFHPFGLAYISAVLNKNGYCVDCIDLHNEEILNGNKIDSWDVVSSYNIFQYGVVAFGGTFLKFNILKSLSEKIWQVNKNIFQIAGGNMATIISDFILRETKVQSVCMDEGEETIIELLGNLKNGNWRTTRGIRYLNEKGEVVQTPERGKIENLDEIPFPDRKNWSFDILRKAFPNGSPGRYCAIMFASRGCPFSCIFCNPLSGKRIRSPENIIEEIKYLKQNWNIGYVRFFDENFIGSKEKIKQLCELMIKEKLNIFWWCQTQIKFIDEEVLNFMKRAGCIEISYGIESGSNAILNEMRKGITKELARETIALTYKIGIRPSLNLIAGTPLESYETLQETKDFIKSLNYINWPQIPTIDFIVPIPNTELYRLAKAGGLIVDEKKYLTEELFELGRYTKTVNLTKMADDFFLKSINDCNKEITNDYYFKHPMKKLLSAIGLNHLRIDLIFKNFNLRQALPLIEALLWSILGKRNNFLAKYVNLAIYNRNKNNRKNIYWKKFLGVPTYKIDWYFKYFLYKCFGFTFDKLKEQKVYWNSRGKEYFKEFFDSEYYKYEIFFQDLLIEQLKNLDFSSIFEAGCGFGWNVKRIKKEFSNLNIGGFDFSRPQLINSRYYHPDVFMPVAQGDACHMPFKDKTFDVGFTMGVFMNIHPENIDKAIDELLRVAKKYIIHIEWDQNNTTPKLREERIFKTNIVSHDYKKLYERRGKRVLNFATFKDFGNRFLSLFPSTKIGFWKPYEGAEKYILIVVKV